MAVFGHARASKGSRCQFNTINLMQVDWRGTWRGEDVDTSNFEALGFEQGTIGFQVFEYQSNGIWNALRNPIDSPPGIFPTDAAPNVYFFTSVSDNVFWLLPLARVLSAETQSGNLKNGAVGFNFQGKSQSNFTVPTGSF